MVEGEGRDGTQNERPEPGSGPALDTVTLQLSHVRWGGGGPVAKEEGWQDRGPTRQTVGGLKELDTGPHGQSITQDLGGGVGCGGG